VLTNLIQSDVRVDFQPWDQNMLTSGSFATLTDAPANVMYNLV
jgi:hypothetical protein